MLPSRLFRCETLESLELDRVIVSEVPSRFSFRSLKTLRLLAVKYPDEESFVRLISSCPVLEDLVVHTCHKDNVVTFTIDVPSLQNLSIGTAVGESEPDDHLFVIHSHSLKQLKCSRYYGEVQLIGNAPKLVEANLQSVCKHIKVLGFYCFADKCLDKARYPTGSVLSQLMRLELRFWEDNWANILASLLQHSPKLQALKIVMKGNFLAVDGKGCWIQPSVVPECLLRLKTFEWRVYRGTKVEKEVATYILKNARQLVTATIYPSEPLMFEELEIATRNSRACVLTMG